MCCHNRMRCMLLLKRLSHNAYDISIEVRRSSVLKILLTTRLSEIERMAPTIRIYHLES